jgi:hypothetical protein
VPGTVSGLPEPVEDATQFFLYRVQVGAALERDRLTPADIASLLGPPVGPPDPLHPRLQEALAAALRQDRAQARAAARLAEALGGEAEAPLAAWARQRTRLLVGAPASRLRDAVAAFPLRGSLLRRLWGRLFGR